MLFRTWGRYGYRERTSRRIKCAERAIRRDRDNNALTPELVKFQSVDERLDSFDRHQDGLEQTQRALAAKHWRKGRALLRGMDEPLRTKALHHWNRGIYPSTAVYSVTMMRSISLGQFDIDEYNRELERVKILGQKYRDRRNTQANEGTYTT